MTTDEALLALATQTAEAVLGALEIIVPGAASHGTPVIAADMSDALAAPPVPGLAASVAYVDRVTGGNVFLLGRDGARRLAAAMTGRPADAVSTTGELDELEHSAVAEAMNQMIAAAAAITSQMLGYEVEVSPPELSATDSGDLAQRFEGTAHAISTSFTICEHPCRLVQLVPQTSVVRMRGALSDLGSDHTDAVRPDAAAQHALLGQMHSTRVRLSAEIGRTKLPIEQLVEVPAGTVIELDREVDDPIDLYVNGHPFAVGRLVVTEAAEWAVRIERLLDDQPPDRER